MLWLVYNGVPWHTALGVSPGEHVTLSDTERLAAAIIFGQFSGGRWDWNAMEYVTKSG